jgi:CheY-like chemotaxis protein/anti-sigma regulatory factor (Ser/Thr protein kinase)
MAKILVAEDSQAQAVQIRSLLEKAGHTVQMAVDGDAALAIFRAETPEIVLTDMHMPGMTGLELIEAVRASHPDVPVVMMTSDGTEDLAVEALRKGASNYIPKRRLGQDLISIIDGIAEMLDARKSRGSVLSALTHADASYTFGNHREFANTLISQFESDLRSMVYDNDTELFRIVTAIKEAILNAIDHGNLELDSALRDEGEGAAFYELAKIRATQEPYCYRKITVTSRVSPEQLAYVIRDDGPGFDPATLPDPNDPENILRSHGRGLMLIRSFMDDVVFNEKGNQITLIKYRQNPQEDLSDEPPMLLHPRNLRILMAEDSVTNQVLAKSLLEREGHAVTIACNGAEAVQLSLDDVFDLILMDIEMPELDGLSATREIREREKLTGMHVPIVAMSAHDADDDLENCKAAGMQGHIAKPVRAETLNAVLARM